MEDPNNIMKTEESRQRNPRRKCHHILLCSHDEGETWQICEEAGKFKDTASAATWADKNAADDVIYWPVQDKHDPISYELEEVTVRKRK